MVEPKNGSTILKPQNVKAVTTKFDIAKPQKRDSDNHINGKAQTINFDRHPFFFLITKGRIPCRMRPKIF